MEGGRTGDRRDKGKDKDKDKDKDRRDGGQTLAHEN